MAENDSSLFPFPSMAVHYKKLSISTIEVPQQISDNKFQSISYRRIVREMADNGRPHLGFDTESILTQHAICAFLINTLTAQMQVKYKSTTASPFDTHNWVMLAFLVALFIYATATVAEVMLRVHESIYHHLVGYIRLFASGFATILLLVVLDPILGSIISVLWVSLFAMITYASCKSHEKEEPNQASDSHQKEEQNQANDPPSPV